MHVGQKKIFAKKCSNISQLTASSKINYFIQNKWQLLWVLDSKIINFLDKIKIIVMHVKTFKSNRKQLKEKNLYWSNVETILYKSVKMSIGLNKNSSLILWPILSSSVCLSLLYRRLSLPAEPIWFTFTGYLLIGPGKDYNYFWGRCYQPSKRNLYL